MSLNQLTNPAQANWPVIVNENLAAAGVELYAYNYQTTTGLTEGGYGGNYGTTVINAWTVTLTASDTNYIVAHRTTGSDSVSIATTNWDDTEVYGRVRQCVTDGSGTTSRIDWRFLEGGIFATGSSGAGAVDAADVTYSPIDLADWVGSADPGDAADALDQLASRVVTLEAGGGGGGGGTGTKTYGVHTPMTSEPPASNFATLDTRNSRAVLDFDAGTEETILWNGLIPEGAVLSSGLKVFVHWRASTATSGDVVWGVSFERDNTDIDSDSFDTEATGTGTANGTSGVSTITEITITTIDSLSAGDGYYIKLARKAASGSDTMTGDAEVSRVEVRSAA